MGKHLDKETKYHYVMRYLNGESPTKLGMEISGNTKSPRHVIMKWSKIYNESGLKGLESKTGKASTGRPKKKRKIDPSTLTPEERIEYINIMQDVIEEYEEIIKKKTRARFIYPIVMKLANKYSKSISWMCWFFEVSKSGYYQWKRNPVISNNYNLEWLEIINEEYKLHNGIYGYERIWASLKMSNKLVVNLKTIRRYMKYMNLKSKIRKPKKAREIKETSIIDFNYIKQNFKDDSSRSKVFTDTSEYKMLNSKIYLSAVIDSNQTLLSLDCSYRNDEKLIQKNIAKGISKIGRKYFIQFDNAAFYKNEKMKALIKGTKGIRSYSYPGKSLDNRPIEYLWSILKQEYLNLYKPTTFAELEVLLPRIIFHYNHIRIQKNLDWKTPAKARV